MMDFIVANYIIFIVIAVILLLGLFGYMMDRKKYDEYREEIINEARAVDTLQAAPEVINNVVAPISMNETVPTVEAPVVAPVVEQQVVTAPVVEAPVVQTVPVQTIPVQTVTPVAVAVDTEQQQ